MKQVFGQQGFTAPGWQLTVAGWSFDFSFGLVAFGCYVIVWINGGPMFTKGFPLRAGGRRGRLRKESLAR